MKKSLLVVGLGALVLVAAFYALNTFIYSEKQAYAAADYKDAEYMIDGARVRLVDGVAETEAAPGSASKISTRYFGNELRTDLDGDGREDVVFLITQNTGGSGTFYYAVAALNTERGYVGSDAYLLGDRIAPQTTEVSRNPSHVRVIVVNYAAHAQGEPMTARPSVGNSVYLKLDPASRQWGQVEPDFEGEANPAVMTLGMKTWQWVSALYNDGRELLPRQAGKFSITFGTDGKFTATTDCNQMGGSYTATASTIAMTDIYSTKMYCEGSQETDFHNLLRDSSGYHFTSKGELILDLKFDSGSVTFR
jgi:heat shock protein HslJ